MIIANFCKGDTIKTLYGLWQWDYGQVLRIQGLDLPTAVEIHFSLRDKGGEAVTRIGTTKDGVTDVVIPDSMLENNSSAADYVIYAFVYLTDETSGQTEYKISIQVKARPKPEAFDAPEDTELFREAIQQVNESADRAEAAEKAAGGYANKTSEDAEKTAQDREEVERLVLSVSGIDDDIKLVADYKQAAQTAAQSADTSAKAAKSAQTQAETAKEAAETAQKSAETAAKEAAEDKTAVEQAKADVQTMQSQVAQDRTSVEQTKASFELTAQQAVADVNNAGQNQVDRVEETGGAAVQDIDTAKTQAVQEVSSAGAAQVAAVQEAAQEIVADREQIQQNAQDIASIQQELVLKAPAIIQSVSGNPAIVQDSAEASVQNLTMQGWTEQKKTTGKNLFDINTDKQMGYAIGEVGGAFSLNATNVTDFASWIKDCSNLAGQQIAIRADSEAKIRFIVLFINSSNIILEKYNDTFPGEFGFYTTTVPQDAEKLCISILDNDAYNSDLLKIQVEKGSVFTSHEPYTGGAPSPSPDYPQEIVSAGDWDDENEKYGYEIKITGKNILDFSKTQDIANWFASVRQPGYSDFPVYVGKGKTVTISLPEKLNTGINLYVGVVLREQGTITQWMYHRNEENLIRRVITVTAVEDYIWIRCVTRAISTTFQENFGQLMIEYGTEATAYEPYKSQDVTLTSDRPLTEWDRLEKRNGVWGWAYKSDEIESYTDESIPGEYYSSTGQLSAGAQIWYETESESFVPLTDTEQDALNALHTNYPTTVISNEQDCDMSLTYIADATNYINKAIQEAIQASIANNLLSANSTQALSAKMGAELNSRIEALEE